MLFVKVTKTATGCHTIFYLCPKPLQCELQWHWCETMQDDTNL